MYQTFIRLQCVYYICVLSALNRTIGLFYVAQFESLNGHFRMCMCNTLCVCVHLLFKVLIIQFYGFPLLPINCTTQYTYCISNFFCMCRSSSCPRILTKVIMNMHFFSPTYEYIVYIVQSTN